MDIGDMVYSVIEVPTSITLVLLNWLIVPTDSADRPYTFYAGIFSIVIYVTSWSIFVLAPTIYSLGWNLASFNNADLSILLISTFSKVLNVLRSVTVGTETLLYSLSI